MTQINPAVQGLEKADFSKKVLAEDTEGLEF
jgi:hypothetical protein